MGVNGEKEMVQGAELKFPGIEEGHEVNIEVDGLDIEASCTLAPKQLLKGNGRTTFKFAFKHNEKVPV